MSRRALIFNVAPGRETHYSKIKGEYIGRRWAPLFHAYGYYLPRANVEDPEYVDKLLTVLSKEALKLAILQNIVMLPLGVNAVLINMLGSVIWAESESLFAYWDGYVSFGSSHLTAHWIGYGLATLLIKKGLSIWTLPLLILSVKALYEFGTAWKHDGYRVTSDRPSGMLPFRTDHLAHIGGVVAGALSAWVTRKKRL